MYHVPSDPYRMQTLRQTGFNVPVASRADDSLAVTSTAPLSINPNLLHDASDLFASDNELAELESLLRQHAVPSTVSEQQQQQQQHPQQQLQQQQQHQQQHHAHQHHHHHQQQQPHHHQPHRHRTDQSFHSVNGPDAPSRPQPLRSLPRHLDPSGFSSGSPVNDMYSPGSGSTSAGLSGGDLFQDATDFASVSDDLVSPTLSPEPPYDRIGRANGPSGKALSSRSRTTRRPSGSYARPDMGHSSIIIPNSNSVGSGYGAASAGGTFSVSSAPSRPQAMSVPTYLPHNGPVSGIWDSSTASMSPPSAASFAPSAFFPHSPTSSQSMRLSGSLGGTSSLKASSHGAGSASPASAPAVTTMDNAAPSATAEDKQAAALSEKRRKRRESHNLVERKRRDKINEQIAELATLLPDYLLEAPSRALAQAGEEVEEESGGDAGGASAMSPQATAAAARPNKGVVLSKSVEYIRLLVQRNHELESMIREFRINPGFGGGMDLSASATTIRPVAKLEEDAMQE